MVLALRVQVFVVGHDWGAIVSWNLCLLRPDRVRALVNLSVAFSPRSPGVKPIEYFRAAYGDDYYVCRFQVSNCSSYRPNGCAAATYSETEGSHGRKGASANVRHPQIDWQFDRIGAYDGLIIVSFAHFLLQF
jgi:pimeloyl-ACP methyl ester carboxylesterase